MDLLNITKAYTNPQIIKYIKTPKIPWKKADQENSGTYILTCSICQSSYVGQTGHSLKQRYLKHKRYIKYNNTQPAYALHIIQNIHE